VTSRRGRGRLDNGLDAALWSPVRDVDPRIGEHLLDVLSAVGIAAYLEPSADVGPYTRTVFLPSPPSDRLFVDRARRREARGLVDELLEQDETGQHRERRGAGAPAGGPARPAVPERPQLRPDLDEEAEWAAIVAALEADNAEATRPGTAVDTGVDTGVDTAVDTAEDSAVDAALDGPVVHSAEPLPPPPAPHEPAILDRPDEHFEPPPPPPMPVPSPAVLYAVLLIAAGLLLLGAPSILALSGNAGLLLGSTLIAGGVAMLVTRMRDRSDDDGDDGAVV